jgi:hypothetical protein
MERESSFCDSGPERNVKFTIAHMLVSRVGVFVLCAVMSTLGCKSSSQSHSTESQEHPATAQDEDENAENRASRRRDERDEDRALFKGDDRR